jgi:hypothetical protein
MAKFSSFNGTNNLSSKQIFNERLKYEIGLFDETTTIPKPMIKFYTGEFQFYGKVDETLKPITIKKNKLKLLSNKNNLFVLDFVEKQFKAMKQNFDKCVTVGSISKEDPYLSTLSPTKAYISIDEQYSNYIKDIITTFNNDYIIKGNRLKNVLDFNSYMNNMIDYSNLTSQKIPITRSSFIKTNNCSMNTSGLVIELADLPFSDDAIKFEFTSSPNFKFFQNACIKYGFSIDYNVPWRIIADIDSPPMQESMISLGYNRSTVFVTHFDDAVNSEIENIKTVLYNGYNLLSRNQPISKLVTQCNKRLVSEIIERPQISKRSVNNMIDDTVALQIFINMRASEQEVPLSKQIVSNITKNSFSYLTSFGISSSLQYVQEQMQTKQLAGSGTLNSIVLSLQNRKKG